MVLGLGFRFRAEISGLGLDDCEVYGKWRFW